MARPASRWPWFNPAPPPRRNRGDPDLALYPDGGRPLRSRCRYAPPVHLAGGGGHRWCAFGGMVAGAPSSLRVRTPARRDVGGADGGVYVVPEPLARAGRRGDDR